MEKKNLITVKHFLNKRLKPKVYRRQEFYPSYCQVTYLRHNTQFLFDWDAYVDFDEDESMPYPNRFTEKRFSSFEKEESDLIKSINLTIDKAVLFEENKHGKKFNLKGFSKRLEFYNECFSCEFRGQIGSDLMDIIMQEMTRKQFDRLWEKLDWFSMLDMIEYIEKKHISDIKERINEELNDRINTYYLIESFMEKYESARTYEMWLFNDGLSKFTNYLKSNAYLDIENPFFKDIEKLKFKDDVVYHEIIKKFINQNLKKMEVSHYE